jgi:hypothetical protein
VLGSLTSSRPSSRASGAPSHGILSVHQAQSPLGGTLGCAACNGQAGITVRGSDSRGSDVLRDIGVAKLGRPRVSLREDRREACATEQGSGGARAWPRGAHHIQSPQPHLQLAPGSTTVRYDPPLFPVICGYAAPWLEGLPPGGRSPGRPGCWFFRHTVAPVRSGGSCSADNKRKGGPVSIP